jgi:hypothetical protein
VQELDKALKRYQKFAKGWTVRSDVEERIGPGASV